MILNDKIISHAKGVHMGDALRQWLDSGSKPEREIWEKYIKELLDREYDQLPTMLLRVFSLMKLKNIGLDYDLFYADMDNWDEFDQLAKKKIARSVWGDPRGGKREGAGRKPKDGEAKVAFPVSRVAPDVAEKVRQSKNMTEFVERAIRSYNEE